MPMQSEIFIKCLSSSSNRNLFVFPHAGASPASYVSALKKTRIDMNVYVLSLPGRLFQDKKKQFSNFSEVLVHLVSFIGKFKNEEIFLLGHSMGCLFAYEIAKHIQNNFSSALVSFGLSAIRVPDHRFRARKISQFDDLKFKKYTDDLHFIPEEIKSNPEFYSDFLETLKNDFRLIDSYQEPLSFFNNKAKAIIFGFEQDLIAPPDELTKWTEYFSNCEGPIILAGDHFQFLESLPLILNKLLK